MPILRAVDWDDEEEWKNIIRENIFSVRQEYEANKFILYRNLNISLLFWEKNDSNLRLSMTLDGDKIICYLERYKDQIEYEMEYSTFQKLICENS